jgi:hypothetical protein
LGQQSTSDAGRASAVRSAELELPIRTRSSLVPIAGRKAAAGPIGIALPRDLSRRSTSVATLISAGSIACEADHLLQDRATRMDVQRQGLMREHFEHVVDCRKRRRGETHLDYCAEIAAAALADPEDSRVATPSARLASPSTGRTAVGSMLRSAWLTTRAPAPRGSMTGAAMKCQEKRQPHRVERA